LFMVWLYAWGVHGLLGPWTTAIFLAPGWWTLARGGAGSIPLKALRAWWPEGRVAGWLTALGLALWVTECAAAPLFWDAVADHFHFAREVARTGFLPEGWILFNGMGPKAAQLLLAGGFPWVARGSRTCSSSFPRSPASSWRGIGSNTSAGTGGGPCCPSSPCRSCSRSSLGGTSRVSLAISCSLPPRV
jgi:hypothetical protein